MTSEKQYLNLCEQILNNGTFKSDRTNTGTYSIFGSQMSFDLNEGFPLLTTKKVPFKLVSSVIFWFYEWNNKILILLLHIINLMYYVVTVYIFLYHIYNR